MLSVGAALLGSPCVLALDVDSDALDTAISNCEQFEDPLPIEFVHCDVATLPARVARLVADTVVMNPPFGTKRKGVDMQFLRAAFCMSRGSVYSLHKSSTRAYIEKVQEDAAALLC